MAKMNMIQALNSALDNMMEKDPNVVSFGEDAGYFGGVFRVTAGLHGATFARDSFTAAASCGALLPGAGLAEFAQRLTRRRTEPIRILVLGSAVARWNHYHTSASFRRALQSAFPTVATVGATYSTRPRRSSTGASRSFRAARTRA